MNDGILAAGWHRESMLRFYRSGLRALLAGKVGAKGYRCVEGRDSTVDVELGVETKRGLLAVGYRGLPLPDGSGVFSLEGRKLVVIPVAESEELSECRVLCAGEQALAFLTERIGGGPSFTEWDEELLRSLVPLERLIAEFLASTGRELEATNAYSAASQLRRIFCPAGRAILPDSQLGLVCPVEQADKPDELGRVLTLSRGARIEGEKVRAPAGDPARGLGPTAASIPFVHHTDPMRAQIGALKMHQWEAVARPEPALVQTGLEPEGPGCWVGCDLLTAFASYGKATYEDSLLLSEGAAARLGFDAEGAVGALLSNRCGQKGVVGTVLPEERMPHLPDGTPVELAVSFIALHARMNAGQLMEAAASWIAHRSGRPYVAIPFADGDRERIERELPDAPYRKRLCFDEGREAEAESFVGWVYWGLCTQHASNRLMVGGAIGQGRFQRQGEMENHVLIRRGAFRTIQERFTVLASEETAAPGWSVLYGSLRRKLAAAGIRAEMSDAGLELSLAEPGGSVLELELPLEHPWLPGHTLRAVGVVPEAAGFEELRKANRPPAEGLALPPSLRVGRAEHLQLLLERYFAGLLTQMDLRMGNRPCRSGRGMIAVGTELSYDQVGIPRRMAEALSLGPETEWVVLNRAPTMADTAIVAFHPVPVSGDAIRLAPYLCRWMNADFDGDQVAVFVPGSVETQKEAGQLLSVLGHVEADPATLDKLVPCGDALWGLALLWLSPAGRRGVRETLPSLRSDDELPARASLAKTLQELREARGAEAAVRKAVELWEQGFLAAARSGATLDPFLAASFPLPEPPVGLEPEAWERHREHCRETLAASREYASPAMGAQLLAVHAGARGEEQGLIDLVQGSGLVIDGSRRSRLVGSGFLSGMDFPGYVAHATVDQERMVSSAAWWPGGDGSHPGFPDYRPYQPSGRHFVARAMRSKHPGIVFARAAAAGETDPLRDAGTRLFVGLLPR